MPDAQLRKANKIALKVGFIRLANMRVEMKLSSVTCAAEEKSNVRSPDLTVDAY